MLKRLLDLVLLALALAGLAYGAYTIGRIVTRESNDAFVQSSGETRPATTTSRPAGGGSSSTRDRNIRIGVAAAGILVLWILLASLVGMIRRRRRRRRREWRLPR